MSDSEAFAPAVVDMSRFQIQDKPVDNSTGQRKRGPGRPPGARNKTKIPEGGINPPAKLILDGGRRNPPKDETLEDAAKREKLEAQKRQEKKETAERYATFINEELNDRLMMLVIGLIDAKTGGSAGADLIYKEGRVPPKAAGNPNLTSLGNAIAIPADVADSWGKLLAELTNTDSGKKIENTFSGGPAVILISAASALFSTYRYSQQLKPVIAFINQQQGTSVQQEQGTTEDQ